MVDRNIGFSNIAADLLDASDGTGQHVMVRTGTNGATIYVFYVDANSDLVYKKSTDSGKTWGSVVIIEGTDAYIGVSVWFDRWTIGDTTGNTIHIFATDSSNLELTYFSLGIDDDLAETNNNVVIDTAATTLTAAPGGRVCGCKAKNGDMLVGYSATAHATQAGWNFYKSDDTGATWALKNSDGNPAQFLDSVQNLALLMPLDTDDDILLIGVDSDQEIMISCVFDNSVSDTWETAERILAQFRFFQEEANGSSQLSCAYDHSNADCFIMLSNNSTDSTSVNTITVFYDESTRAAAFDDYGLSSGYHAMSSAGLDDMIAPLVGKSIIRNSDTGQLIIIGTMGEQSIAVVLGYQVSNDNGRHWSSIQIELGFESSIDTVPDDIRKIRCPPFTDTDSGLQFVRYNDDRDDIECLKYPNELYASETGNCKDDAGVNDEGVIVKMYMEPSTPYGFIPEGNTIFVGQDITDASGNWSIAPLPTLYIDNLGGERNFYVTYYDDKGDIRTPVVLKWRMDRDDWGSKSGTQVTYDTGNDEIDFATASSAVSQHIIIQAALGLTGNFHLKWAIDFDIRLDTLTQGASGIDNDLFVILSSVNGGVDFSSKAFGLRLVVSSTELQWDLIFVTSGAPISKTADSTFATTPTTGTKYFRMGMKSKDTISIALYSAAKREPGDLVEEETFDISTLALTELLGTYNKFLYVALDDSTVANSTIIGAVSNVRLYAESTGKVVSVDTGSNTDLTDLSHVEGQI